MSEQNRRANSSQQQPPMMGPGMRGPGRGPGGPGGRNLFVEKPKDAKTTIKKLVQYIGNSKYLVLGMLVVMIAVTLLQLAAPTLQGQAIDAMTITESTLAVDMAKVRSTLSVLALVYLCTAVMQYFQGLCSALLSQSTVRKMRSDLFARIVKLPVRYIDTHQHGDIMSRMTNDIENISQVVSQSLGSLFSGVLTVIGSIAIMLYYSPALTCLSFVTVFLSMLATAKMSKYMRKYYSRQSALLGQLNGHAEEMITGYHTVVAFSRERQAEEEFNRISTELRQTGVMAQLFGGVMGPMMNVIGNIGFLLIAAFGGYFALQGWISIGVIQAFILYSKQFTRPINEIANLYGQLQTAVAGAERVFAILETEPEVDEGTRKLPEVKGDIDFEHIFFSYVPEKPVLKDFDLHVKRGQRIALVGATGSGKTTVVNLLTRFYDIDQGSIKLDGVDIREIPKHDLRSSIAIVLQDTVLFSDSIAGNIRYGRLDADMDAVRYAAETANADVFIGRLPEGYDTQLSESGSNLSQGQRQLLSIARAVLADPTILILDEATSSVDTRTEMHIQEAMLALMENRTSLIIAHRLSTIRTADKIIVMDDGRIVESGNHEELLRMKGVYYRLYQNQFAGLQT